MRQILIAAAGIIGLLVLWTTAVAAVIGLVFFAFSCVSWTGRRRPRGRDPLPDTRSRDVYEMVRGGASERSESRGDAAGRHPAQ